MDWNEIILSEWPEIELKFLQFLSIVDVWHSFMHFEWKRIEISAKLIILINPSFTGIIALDYYFCYCFLQCIWYSECSKYTCMMLLLWPVTMFLWLSSITFPAIYGLKYMIFHLFTRHIAFPFLNNSK
jgi:hypothetical protein